LDESKNLFQQLKALLVDKDGQAVDSIEWTDKGAEKVKALHKKCSSTLALSKTKYSDLKPAMPKIIESLETRQSLLDKSHAASFRWAVDQCLCLKSIRKKDKGANIRAQLLGIVSGDSRVHREAEELLGSDTFVSVCKTLAIDDSKWLSKLPSGHRADEADEDMDDGGVGCHGSDGGEGKTGISKNTEEATQGGQREGNAKKLPAAQGATKPKANLAKPKPKGKAT